MNFVIIGAVFICLLLFWKQIKSDKKIRNKDKIRNKKISLGNCPYCNNQIEMRSMRARKCPSCKKTIYPVVLPENNKSVFVRQEETERINEKWIEIRRINYWHGVLSAYGITNNQLNDERKKLRERGINSEHDLIWRAFNVLLTDKKFCQNLEKMRSLYNSMGDFVYEKGGNPFEFRQKEQRISLIEEKKLLGNMADDYGVEIFCMDNLKGTSLEGEKECCEECKKFKGKCLTFDKAIKAMPLPVKKCTNKLKKEDNFGTCRCRYEPVNLNALDKNKGLK